MLSKQHFDEDDSHPPPSLVVHFASPITDSCGADGERKPLTKSRRRKNGRHRHGLNDHREQQYKATDRLAHDNRELSRQCQTLTSRIQNTEEEAHNFERNSQKAIQTFQHRLHTLTNEKQTLLHECDFLEHKIFEMQKINGR